MRCSALVVSILFLLSPSLGWASPQSREQGPIRNLIRKCGELLKGRRSSAWEASANEQKASTELFAAAQRDRLAVRFVIHTDVEHVVQGQVVGFIHGRDRAITAVELALDNGQDFQADLRWIDPRSIESFHIVPRLLSLPELRVMGDLEFAYLTRFSVSFRVDHSSYTSLFEGYVTEIGQTTDGRYWVRVNEDSNERRSGETKIWLSQILDGTVKQDPVLEVFGTAANPASESSVTGVLQLGLEPPRDIEVPKTLLAKLSVFADPNSVSGYKLPDELDDLVQPGNDLRLYYTYRNYRIRLTARKDANGRWSFGDTYLGGRPDEAGFFDVTSRSDGTLGFQPNEWLSLAREAGKPYLPASRLRWHMRNIRGALMGAAVRGLYPDELKKWEQAIPEDFEETEVLDLFLWSLGKSYLLDSGIVDWRSQFLGEPERKTLAAIQYLIEHDQVFWSGNSADSDAETGIYPRTGPGPRHSGTARLVAIDFGSSLYQAMERAGLKYVDGRWQEQARTSP